MGLDPGLPNISINAIREPDILTCWKLPRFDDLKIFPAKRLADQEAKKLIQ